MGKLIAPLALAWVVSGCIAGSSRGRADDSEAPAVTGAAHGADAATEPDTVADSGVAETVVADATSEPDTAVADTGLDDTLVAPDVVVSDTLVADSVVGPDVAPDTVTPDVVVCGAPSDGRTRAKEGGVVKPLSLTEALPSHIVLTSDVVFWTHWGTGGATPVGGGVRGMDSDPSLSGPLIAFDVT
ncbi:MAG: hypothetical protein U1F43_11255 [Myxococcota bacterium]